MLLRIARLTQTRRVHLSRRNEKLWDSIKTMFAMETDNSFTPEAIQNMHRSDKMDPTRFYLIYRDPGAAHSHSILGFGFPIALFGGSLILLDLLLHEEKQWSEMTMKLVGDIKDIGYFSILPVTSLFLVLIALFRFQQLRIMRIYQDKQHPEKFTGIVTKSMCFKAKHCFSREESMMLYHRQENETLRMLTSITLGNARLGNRSFVLSDDQFRGNNYRSYMLNETSSVPRLP